MTFKHYYDGKELRYFIERSWNCITSINEKFKVYVNNKFDKLLSDHWLEYVDGFIPVNISNLFLFDGEKIEDFADEDQSKRLLFTAINSLLGGAIVDQLETDLLVLEKRKKSESLDSKDKSAINDIYNDIKSSEIRKQDLYKMRAKIKTQIESNKKLLRDEKVEFQINGGDIYEQREDLNRKKAALKIELEKLNRNIHSLVAGVVPLRLIEDLYVSAKEQDERESQYKSQNIAEKIITDRLKKLKTYSKEVFDDDTWTVIQNTMLKGNSLSENYSSYLNIESEKTRHKLNSIEWEIEEKLSDAWASVTDAELRQVKIVDIERALERVPNDDIVAKRLDKIDRLAKEISELSKELMLLEHDYANEENRFDMLKTKILNIIEQQTDDIITGESNQRIIEYSNKARATLQIYKSRLISKYIETISKHILDCFSLLIRKENLISKISISSADYEILLYGYDNTVLSPSSLSAGERQLFAISTLWGLAKASGRPLPVIIDTPLGRLDSSHRTHLLNNYFPNASHQVILLSTDEEIDNNYYDMLKPSISHSYTLDFDQEQRSTKIKKGYIF